MSTLPYAQFPYMIQPGDNCYVLAQRLVYRLTKDYAADIAIFDQVEQQALSMADDFTEGIVKQFPAFFSV